MALPKVPKLLDVRGLDPALKPLADRTWEWVSGAQDLLRALRQGVVDGTIGGGGVASTAATADTAKALKTTTTDVDVSASAAPSSGQVLTATDPTHATWQTPASAPVSSVFGRTGAVTAQSGDYTAAQITGAVPDTRQVLAGTGLTGGGDLTADRTLSLDTSVAGGAIEVPYEIASAYAMRDKQTSQVDGRFEIDAGVQFTMGEGSRLALAGNLSAPRPRWVSDTPAAYPSHLDDHFDGATLDPKWRTFDPGSFLTKTLDTTRRMVKLTMTGNGAVHAAGIYQPTYGGPEFALYTRMFLNYNIVATGGATGGLAVFGDIVNNPTTAPFMFIRTSKVSNGSTSIIIQSAPWGNYTTAGVAGGKQNYDFTYFRLRISGTTYFSDGSCDGIGWNQIDTGTLTFTPLYVGMVVFVQDSGVTGNFYFDFFEFKTGSGSSGIDATQIGQYT